MLTREKKNKKVKGIKIFKIARFFSKILNKPLATGRTFLAGFYIFEILKEQIINSERPYSLQNQIELYLSDSG